MTDIVWNYTIYGTRSKAVIRLIHTSCSRAVFSPLCSYYRRMLGFGTGDIAQKQ